MGNTVRGSLYKAIPHNTRMEIKIHRINFYAKGMLLKTIAALFTFTS